MQNSSFTNLSAIREKVLKNETKKIEYFKRLKYIKLLKKRHPSISTTLEKQLKPKYESNCGISVPKNILYIPMTM